MIDSLQLLPIDTLLLILNNLSIKQQLRISLLNKFFNSVSSQSIFEKVIIVFSSYKPVDRNHYTHKFNDYTVIKSSPHNLDLLVQKITFINKVIILDSIKGLNSNWIVSRFHQLACKSDIQHCFSVRSLSKIKPDIKTLELDLVNKGSISSSEKVLKYSGLKFLQRIENLIILTNNFNRLYRLEKIIKRSLPQGKKLHLESLLIKTYIGTGDHGNYKFVGSADLTMGSFRMLNFNSIIDLGELTRLELSIRLDKLESSDYWHYHLFKFIFSFFNDYDIIKSSMANIYRVNSLFLRLLEQDFDIYNEFQSWCDFQFHQSKEYNLPYHNLTHLAISIHSSTDHTIPLNLIRSFVLKNEKIDHLSLSFLSHYPNDVLFRTDKHSWSINFYQSISPQLRYLDDRYFIENFISSDENTLLDYFKFEMSRIYKEVTGLDISKFNSIKVLSTLLDNYNNMNLSSQFVTSVSAFETVVPLAHDESTTAEYCFARYVSFLPPNKRREIVSKFTQLLKIILQRELIFDRNTFDEPLQLRLNNIPFEVLTVRYEIT